MRVSSLGQWTMATLICHVVLSACRPSGLNLPPVTPADPGSATPGKQASSPVAKEPSPKATIPLQPVVPCSPNSLLVFDAALRQQLRDLPASSPFVIAYDGSECLARLLPQCRTVGSYVSAPLAISHRRQLIVTPGDLVASTAGDIPALLAERQAEFPVLVETWTRELASLQAADSFATTLTGDCAKATHYVRSVALGALRLEHAKAATRFPSIDVGDPATCTESAATGSGVPVGASEGGFGESRGAPGCTEPISLQLERLTCPMGLVWKQGRCELAPLPRPQQGPKQAEIEADVRVAETMEGAEVEAALVRLLELYRENGGAAAIALAAKWYLWKAPDSPATANVLWAQAQALGQLGRDAERFEALQRITEHYPDSNQAPEANWLFALAYCERHDRRQARTLFQQITARYPKSGVASEARRRLQRDDVCGGSKAEQSQMK
jgi:hypothetical protein